MSAKETHDRWLEQKPEGASHPDDCPFCVEDDPTGGAGAPMSDKTYTEAELKAAVADALAPLNTKIAELEAKTSEAEVQAKIDEAVKPVQDQLDEALKNLDLATAKAEAAETEAANVKAYLEAEATAAAEAAEVEARKDSRIEEIKKVASLKDEHIAARADGWAAMSDAEFASFVEDLKAAGAKPAEGSDDKLPDNTKLSTASRETASGEQGKSNLSSILDLRRAGVDPRRV